MRALNDVEIAILKKNNHGTVFTEEELQLLKDNKASFKLFGAADRVLQKHRSYWMTALSRGEAMQNYVRIDSLNLFLTEKVEPPMKRLTNAMELLIEKGIITEKDIEHHEHVKVARAMIHLCNSCEKVFAECGAEKIKFSIDIFPDLTGELADKVVECDGFAQKKKETPEAKA